MSGQLSAVACLTFLAQTTLAFIPALPTKLVAHNFIVIKR